ncbi:MAG: HAMP domain-containing sensor histidine kinase [Planctomycetota bacterium]|nr:HAMP domain-containing sensor histidine kinase [Planctomycetota bacterium]
MDTQADRLQRLIENLLNLARIEAGVEKVDKQNHSLNELLENAYGVVQPSSEQKDIKLIADLSPMYLGVLADRDMLMQSALNLLSNAIKYTKPGGKVTLRSRMEENAAVFEVEDTGVGLTDEDCAKVFEKFYRVKKDQKMAPGTGLGLPLAKHVVEDVHGGKLTVSSQLGTGSIFRISLPTHSRVQC